MIQNIANGYNNYQNSSREQNATASAPIFKIQAQPTADTVQFAGQQKPKEESFLSKHFGKILIVAALATGAVLTHGKLWGKTTESAEKTVAEGTTKKASKLLKEHKIELPEALQKEWDTIIPQIQNRDTETAFIHNLETGEKIAEASTHNKLTTEFDKVSQTNIQKAFNSNQKLAMIHNHPADTTFSSQDLAGIANPKAHYDVMGVVTKGGGLGIFKKVEDLSSFDASRVQRNMATLQAFMGMEIGVVAKLKATKASDLEIFQEVEKLRQTNLPKIAKQFGYEYSYIPPKASSKDIIKFPDYDADIDAVALLSGKTRDEILASNGQEDYFAPNFLENCTEEILEIQKKIQAA